MKYIRNDSTNPYYNLALEEYVHYNLIDDDYVLLWQNAYTVVIGRHQNAGEEVNLTRAAELGVTVVRRNSGGGAVFHDMGNLNFSWITDWDEEKTDYNKFLEPVIAALGGFGLVAEKQGRNDLTAGGKKISGNAQCVHNGRIMHHGTLLVCSDLNVMPEVLSVGSDKFESKGIKSVRSRVRNINDLSASPVDTETLKQALIMSFSRNSGVTEYCLTSGQISEIETLAKNKYMTWEWNIGDSANYSYRNMKRFPGGKAEVQMNVINGQIVGCKISGDFLALVGVEVIEQALTGRRVERANLADALSRVEMNRFFSISQDELLQCFEV